MTCLTKAELEAAQEDISDLAAVINGPQSGTPSTVTTRLGTVIKTLARVIYETSIPTGSAISGLLDTYFGYTTWRQNSREVLTAARTYYVRSDGSDSNNGLADNAGGAFLTIQKAIDTAVSLDARTFNVTIEVRAGTYVGAQIKPLFGVGVFTIRGDTTTPSNVVISSLSSRGFYFRYGVNVTLTGFKFNNTCSRVLEVLEGSIVLASHLIFAGNPTNSFAVFMTNGGSLTLSGNITFEAGYVTIWYINNGFIQTYGTTITFNEGCTCATYTYLVNAARTKQDMTTIVGTLTGRRANVNTNSILLIGAGGETALPGTIAAFITTQGQII